MSGILYVVGTPIGNLGDITARQLEILAAVDIIAAEDTRVTRKLLSHFDIHTPLTSYHEHSTQTVRDGLLARLAAGESMAVVSDAGMPCISDPGAKLILQAQQMQIPIQVVPGPSAAISALAISGQDTGRFCFEGFLSVTKKQRYSHLQALQHETRTMIFYEAPHKLKNTLQDMLQTFGDRSISICRELTKLHEEVCKTTLSEAVAYYETNTPRGEYVLVIAGEPPLAVTDEMSLEDALVLVRAHMEQGLRTADACREAAAQTGFSKRELYQAILKQE
ncbi:MAG: 16S rRNA (cytidine(1402)-2'-O)-methyltransferase [Oscillospiraceae bacterium]|nr:16S rRNA (cytidine(1402)-2'-O)-methyltransferase [Oscillospiraceae bacterium]